MFECMDDCVHLKACRRIQAIGRKHRLLVPRYCTEECSAYRNINDIVKEVDEAIEWAFDAGRDGYDWTRWDKSKFAEWLIGGEE